MARRGLLGAGIAATALAWTVFGTASAGAATNVVYVTGPAFALVGISGEADVDQIAVSVSGNTITVTDQGPGGIATTSAPTCTPVDPMTVTCPLVSGGVEVLQVSVGLGAGDDTFVNQNLDKTVSITPDDGVDDVRSGPADDFIDDSLGNDTYDGGPGDDFLDGTSGNSDTGADVLNGGPGSDFVDYAGLIAGVNVSLGDQLANDGLAGEGDNLLGIEDVEGTDKADTLRGSDASNEITGLGGDDVLIGGRGNDTLFGQQGEDVLNGGASRDGAPDRLDCGSATDVALAAPEDRVLPNCERSGARVVGENAPVSRRRARVKVKCPAAEVTPCFVRLRLHVNGLNISKGRKLKIKAGKSTTVDLKLTRPGKRRLRRSNGNLLVSALVDTRESGGHATTEAQILLFR